MATVLETQPAAATGMYARLGVRTFINASGHNTAQGGSLMPPEVLRAMQEAAGGYVSLRALQEAAGARIAEVVGAPAAVVSAGAAGAILLGAAAALTGTDAAKIVALPETAAGARNEFVVWSSPRPNYMYQACQAAGGTLVEVGQGSAAMSAAPLCQAIGDRTAGVLLVLAPIDISLGRGPGNALLWPDRIGEVATAANAAGVPVLVDAASELPPRDLIRRLLDLGAAGVIVSGGKAIRGPQASGVLAGRADLIAAAHLNNNPLAAIGRPMKVGKEEICGLVAAVERFFAMDEAAQLAAWDAAARTIAGAVPAGSGVGVQVIADHPGYGRPPLVPKAVLTPDGGAAAVEALAEKLMAGDPAISPLRQGEHLIFNPMTLMPGEEQTIADRLGAALRA
jgi:L-seryl-tRNA(Ser) seleniumtransferase